MGLRRNRLSLRLEALQRGAGSLRAAGEINEAIQRFLDDAGAARFHLGRDSGDHGAMIVAILGGTGAGKSTLLNRLLGREVSAASFRRTFTGGAVAVAKKADDLPEGWLGMPHVMADAGDGAVRGKAGVVTVVSGFGIQDSGSGEESAATNPEPGSQNPRPILLVDTPDLDGDQPVHHAQADRVFRWADAVVFLVSPEKYQMTELLPYYRLAGRYAIAAVHVMNKCESAAMLADYASQRGVERVYAIPRDDAAYEAPPEANLDALREALAHLRPSKDREQGLARRAADLAGRFQDDVIEPMRRGRKEADVLIAALKAMASDGFGTVGVDVNPITRQLRHRLRQRSVLYLLGPQRVLDRVRQTPLLLARLPRATWDVLIRGKAPHLGEPQATESNRNVPDFAQLLKDQFTQLLSRIDDAVRSNEAGSRWIEAGDSDWRSSRINPAEAGTIAEQELADLKEWLQQRWNATPRDTRLLQAIVRKLPGGNQVLKWTETAPYLLTIVLAAHGALFGHVDLAVLGGYSLVAWIMERMSNEVAARTRLANSRIERRFTELAGRQIRRSIAWIDGRVPSRSAIKQLERLANELADAVQS
jgi:hypothetical protein